MLVTRSFLVGVILSVGLGCSSGASPRSTTDASVTDRAPTDDVAALTDVTTTHDTGAPHDVHPTTDVPTIDASATDIGTVTDTGTDGGICPGGCATGFICGAGGICRSTTGVPAFGNVYLVMMENTSLSSLRGSSNAPYVNELLRTVAVASNYTSVAHPSLPNYIALTSGGTQGIVCDCDPSGQSRTCDLTCVVIPSCNCNQNVPHIGDSLDEFVLSWRAYGQSMGTPCNTVTSGPYAARHLPFLYYDNVLTNATRCNDHVRDYGDFTADRGTYRFSMISPDLCHDMHDSCTPTNQPILQGDMWLAANVPLITGAPGFANNGVLFIVWDEGDLSLSDNIVLLVISPFAKTAYTSTMAYNHYSLLATIEDGLGIPRLGSSVSAAPVIDLFR